MNEPIAIPALPPLPNPDITHDIVMPVEHPTLGTVKMTGDQARNLYQPAQAIPAHPSLTPSDVGLIVTSVDGMAKVATVSGGVPAAPGSWHVQVKNPVFVRPTMAEHNIKFVANAADGEYLMLFGKTYTFVSGTPVGVRDIQIGATHADTAMNAATVINAYGLTGDYYTASYSGSANVVLHVGPALAGVQGNDTGYSTNVIDLGVSIQTAAFDNDLANVDDLVLTWQKNNDMSYGVTVGDLCNASAPQGDLLGGYRWPVDKVQAAENLYWALNQKVEFYSEFEASYTAPATIVEIHEMTPPVGEPSNITAASIYNYEVLIMDYSEVLKPPYVRDAVLGVLLYIRDDKAFFSPSLLFRAKLSADSMPVVFDEHSAKPSPRILSYADGGCVKYGFTFDYGEETYFGNGFVLALEQGGAGQTILCQRVFFIGG